jgi:cell wall-associated NlpC family hydrolase
MPSTSGLGYEQRIRCRDRVVQAARLAAAHEPQVHYTMGSQRWQGISKGLNAAHGQFPTQADCSSFVTWCLWNGLYLRYGLGDTVNGHDWKAGYTGTLLDHGRRVLQTSQALRGDLVFYDNPRHVAIIVSRVNGVPRVISHGSEGGPSNRVISYRPIMQIHRYI